MSSRHSNFFFHARNHLLTHPFIQIIVTSAVTYQVSPNCVNGTHRALGENVLRITTQITTDSASLKLEGSVKGPWVDELENTLLALIRTAPGKKVNVDLHAVSFLDQRGRDLLLRAQQQGAVLQGTSGFLNSILADKDRTTSRS
jgi:hypothetical protein